MPNIRVKNGVSLHMYWSADPLALRIVHLVLSVGPIFQHIVYSVTFFGSNGDSYFVFQVTTGLWMLGLVFILNGSPHKKKSNGCESQPVDIAGSVNYANFENNAQKIAKIGWTWWLIDGIERVFSLKIVHNNSSAHNSGPLRRMLLHKYLKNLQ